MISIGGVLAAASTPIIQAFGFIIWGEHWRGSAFALNLFKCSLASILFIIVSVSIRMPSSSPNSTGMLMLSSFLGIIVGDYAWLRALQLIGARQVIAFDILKPFLAAILGHILLSEPLTAVIGFGLLISSLGIFVVAYEATAPESMAKQASNTDDNIIKLDVLESSTHSDNDHTFSNHDDSNGNNDNEIVSDSKDLYSRYLGYVLAICNVVFDAYGFVLTKQYGSHLNTWEINMIRFGFASLCMIAISIACEVRAKLNENLRNSNSAGNISKDIEFSALDSQSSHHDEIILSPIAMVDSPTIDQDDRDVASTPTFSKPVSSQWYQLPFMEMTTRSWLYIIVGVIFVTFIGTALTNYAVFQIDLGLCLTLTSTGPIVSIPIVYYLRKETTSIQGFGGSVLTVLGIVILVYSSNPSILGSQSDVHWTDFEVTMLPGWYGGALPSKHFSGYVNSTHKSKNSMTMHTHYWFIESEDQPSKNPLVLWFNGGPGASSVYGNLVEIGPFRLSDLSFINESYKQTGVPQLIYNPQGWQTFSNLLFISMPPPVGYSYCSPAGPSKVGDACGSWNDSSVADLTYESIKSWLTLFEPYRNHTIYITGESYAGIYIPMIVKRIVDNLDNFPVKIAGFAIGDACTPPAICGKVSHRLVPNLKFLYGKSAFSINLNERIKSTCTETELLSQSISSKECQNSLNQVTYEVGGYYDYSYYDECWYDNNFSSNNKLSRKLEYTSTLPTYSYHTGIDGYPCGTDRAMFEWLTHPHVKSSLHVPLSSVFYQVDNAEGFPYYSTEDDIISWYKEIVSSNKMRILIYTGDTDPAINSYRSQDWVRSMGFAEREAWRPWTSDGCQRIGGYVTRYVNGLDHLTIKGSGHMVPLFKPEYSIEFIKKFIRDEEYLNFDSTCSGKSFTKPTQVEDILLAQSHWKLREAQLLKALQFK